MIMRGCDIGMAVNGQALCRVQEVDHKIPLQRKIAWWRPPRAFTCLL